MIYGKNAWDNANLNPDEVLNILSDDNWKDNNIGEFINFWSNSLYLIINGMEKRIISVVKNIFNNPAPSLNDIIKSLKTKSSRWPNIQENRIASILHNFFSILSID